MDDVRVVGGFGTGTGFGGGDVVEVDDRVEVVDRVAGRAPPGYIQHERGEAPEVAGSGWKGMKATKV